VSSSSPAGRGIGAAICVLAAKHGHGVVVNYASDTAAAEGVADRADVADEDEVRGLFDTAVALGLLTGLVNNAAITGNTPGRLDEQDVRTVRRVLEVNVTGTFLCAREAVRRMSIRHGGHGGTIVNISSTAARTASANEWVHYAASKAAVETMTVGVAQEVAGEGIRVNAVAPGTVETGLHAAAGCPTGRSASRRPFHWAVPDCRRRSPRPCCGCCPRVRRMRPGPC
jgi:NAD(P)-dependent dehydrogenase (short-subunit alcohol dehydrogenase family)